MASLTCNVQLQKGSFKLNINQQLTAKGVTVIWGASGSGKSLLLRSIAGFEEQATGQVTLASLTMLDSARGDNLKPYCREIGYASQQVNLFPHLNIRDNLLFSYKRNQDKANKKGYQYQDIIKAFDLSNLLEQYPVSLSGGEKQRCAIAQLLLAYPNLLLMDEPLSALDEQAKEPILEFLLSIPKKFSIPVIYVTHAYEELLKIADYVLLLHAGRVAGYYPFNKFCSAHLERHIPANQLASSISGRLLHWQQFGLDKLVCDHQYLFVPKQKQNNNAQVRSVIYAKDVSICLQKPKQTSILNLLEVRVVELINYSDSYALLRLEFESQTLLSLITHKSLKSLDIQIEQKVIAQIKTISFIR